MVLGHEGAGVIEEVGAGVTRVQAGDHVVCSFLPSCGHCRWCATGRQALCDMGATILEGYLPGDRWPLSGKAGSYGSMCMLGSFSRYNVLHENSVVPISKDLPLDKAALVGCGVPTGWGSAVNTGDVRPGETVIVSGVGGIGINAVQGARYAGALTLIAVDPLSTKREKAMELGATHAVGTIEEAGEIARSVTNGNGADTTIVTAGLVEEDVVTGAFHATGKGGTVVLTGVNRLDVDSVKLPSALLTLFGKSIKGSLLGDCNPTSDIPLLLDLYQAGRLELDGLITKTYSLEQVNDGIDDLLGGANLRGVIVHEP
jgi:alcohol dehydrogenase (nicotinoprotein)